jgi:hypothetical protein
VVLPLCGGVGPQMIEDIERHTGFDQHGAGFVV